MGINLGSILGGLVKPLTDIVSEVVVDKDRRNEINLEIERLASEADQRLHEELMGQIDVNKTEAQHASVFVAGWRPFIGWVGGVGLGYTFVIAPFVEAIFRVNGYTGDLPTPDASQLMVLVTSLLGVGAMRSYDKRNGTASLPRNAPASVE